MNADAVILNNRRGFFRTAGLAVGAAALSGFPFRASKPLTSVAERQVAAVISQYGSCVGISRDASHATEFKVQVRSLKHLMKVLDPRRLPFERIHVGPGNTLKFQHYGTKFTIVNIV